MVSERKVEAMAEAVVDAERPLTTTDIGDRVGVSDQTVRRARDELKADDRIDYGKVGRSTAFWPAVNDEDEGEAAEEPETPQTGTIWGGIFRAGQATMWRSAGITLFTLLVVVFAGPGFQAAAWAVTQAGLVCTIVGFFLLLPGWYLDRQSRGTYGSFLGALKPWQAPRGDE